MRHFRVQKQQERMKLEEFSSVAAFGELFRKLREAQNLSLRALSKELWLRYRVSASQALLGYIEEQDKLPSLEVLLRLCDYFNLEYGPVRRMYWRWRIRGIKNRLIKRNILKGVS